MSNNNISANTLFHFTNKIDYLINILTNNFYPRYCLENLEYLNPNLEMAIPMVCFCDIPLSQIKNHISRYGEYGIGLSKEWGKKKKINSVMYTVPESHPTDLLKSSLEIACSFWELDDECNDSEKIRCTYYDDIDFMAKYIFGYTRFLKPYENDNITFYDEREWRYIPNMFQLFDNNIPYYLRKEEFNDSGIRKMNNKLLEESCSLKFKPNDIKYIIVKDDEEVLNVERKIGQIKGNKYTYDEIRLLKSRIITLEQIRSDF